MSAICEITNADNTSPKTRRERILCWQYLAVDCKKIVRRNLRGRGESVEWIQLVWSGARDMNLRVSYKAENFITRLMSSFFSSSLFHGVT